MNSIFDVIRRVLRGALQLLLVFAIIAFVVGFLLVGLLVVLIASLIALVTGRKPAPVVMFGRMREQSRRYTQGVWPADRRSPSADIVDVEVTEVREGSASDSTTDPSQRLR